MSWWLWIILGLALLVVEITVDAAFWLLFIGIGAIIVGVGGWLGLTGPAAAQWLLFAGLSLSLLYFFRGRLRALTLKRRGGRVEAVVGEQAIAKTAISPGATGKASLRGAEWDARNIGAAEIPEGARVRVSKVDKLVLQVSSD